MKLNQPDGKRKDLRLEPKWKRVLYLVNYRLHTDPSILPYIGIHYMDRVYDKLISDSTKFAALSAVRAYKALYGNRDIVGNELEFCADIAIDILKHSCNPDGTLDSTPVCVWDNIGVLCGKCYLPMLVFTELCDKFGTDCTVMDLMCYRKPDTDEVPQFIKFINRIVREDLTIPNPDKDAMYELVTNITNNIHRAHREGPKERAVDIVIKYYLSDYPIDGLAEMFKLSKTIIQKIIRCWRERCHAILSDPHSWDAPFSLGIYIFGNSPCNAEYPEFTFLHRIRFLMMHRTKMSRADNVLLRRVIDKLKVYDNLIHGQKGGK